ncbi:BLUF domain-containing protein [Asticcacaulis sp. YBE204]|uniref:BLUF domain-containing protein n=1 Tax=Asticcacaulis sp. YBE204 TaxID=1282363 RepID=UPI0003C3B37A|nr:BLUF domain-containing protein [Asticcacaulis sp. YBE204]ESQ78729.1 hypothetical protein AEYBE204_12145 [Asticcacaulis sp. YBE204]
MIRQVVYRSEYSRRHGGIISTVSSILAASRQNNLRDGITGYLIFDKTHFMQILEGEAEDVRASFMRIQNDPRHNDIVVLYEGTTSHRAFADWSMGGTARSPELEHIFEQHGIVGSLKAADVGDTFIALAHDVALWEQKREMIRGLSTR